MLQVATPIILYALTINMLVEIAEAVGAGTAVENSWSVGCQKPLFWLTVLLQLGATRLSLRNEF